MSEYVVELKNITKRFSWCRRVKRHVYRHQTR